MIWSVIIIFTYSNMVQSWCQVMTATITIQYNTMKYASMPSLITVKCEWVKFLSLLIKASRESGQNRAGQDRIWKNYAVQRRMNSESSHSLQCAIISRKERKLEIQPSCWIRWRQRQRMNICDDVMKMFLPAKKRPFLFNSCKASE